MSGHSKWKTIKFRKGAQDVKKGKAFTKVTKELMLAAKAGGGDQATNARLRSAIAAAKAVNLPKDKIDTAIKKGTGELGGGNFDEITYEGYGPGGVAILIEAATDNRNRTVAEIRSILAKGGGQLGESGCVGWMFDKKGVLELDKAKYTEDQVMEVALEAGAEDVQDQDDMWEVTTAPEDFEAVRQALEDAGMELLSAEVSMVAKNTVTVDAEAGRKLMKLMDTLDDNDDVQQTHSNFDLPEELLADWVKGVMTAVIVLGLDPGSRNTGWGLVREESGVLSLVDAGVIRVQSLNDMDLRLGAIYNALASLLGGHKPDEAAMEDVFVSKNPSSALKLGQARGAAMAACAVAGVRVHAYEPTVVKKSLVGVGRAEKSQVAFMVAQVLGCRKPLAEDASDALAVAVCHLNQRRFKRLSGEL